MTRRSARRISLLITAVLTAALGLSAPAAQAGSTIPPGDYQQVSLASGSNELGEAMSLAVLPNRSVVHTARDGSVRITDAAGTTTLAGQAQRLHPRRGRTPRRRGRPQLRHEPLRLPLLLTTTQYAGRRRADRRNPGRLGRLEGRTAPLQIHPQDRQHARPGQREDRAPGSERSRSVLPRRRRSRLRCRRQPLSDHRRRQQPVPVGQLHADRRADQPQPAVRRATHGRQHQRPARQAAPDPPADRTARTRSRPATCSRPAPRRPGPRSTRWASATRSG